MEDEWLTIGGIVANVACLLQTTFAQHSKLVNTITGVWSTQDMELDAKAKSNIVK